ncbi:MAG: thiamine pyrophosphate-binding protein [Pseudomonadales bacterium]
MTGNVKAVTANAFQNGPNLNQKVAEKYTYSDLVVDYLAQVGVEYVFGIQGGLIEPFYNAVARRRSRGGEVDRSLDGRVSVRKRDSLLFGPKPIFSRHECGAAFMADGYSRETGKLGVCVATAGPGSTNLLTGVATAYEDNIPLLVITPQTSLPSLSRGGLQESSSDTIDVVGMFAHCTRYNSLVSHVGQLQNKLGKAIVRAFQHPRGPVHISIPMDILNMDVIDKPTIPAIATQMREPVAVDRQALSDMAEDMVSMVRAGQKQVFMLGHGCGDAISDIMRLAELLNADIVTSPSGKRWVNAYHPLYKGVFGFSGHGTARDALEASDVSRIYAVGTNLGETETAGWDSALLNEKLIHIEPCAENFSRSPMAFMHVQGRLKSIFSELRKIAKDEECQPLVDYQALSQQADFNRLPEQIGHVGDTNAYYFDSSPVKPQRLMLELSRRLPAHTRYLTDAGAALLWGLHALHPRLSGGHRSALGFGTMAWAVGAAVGTSIASRGAPVACITGDGAYLMSAQELTVAVQYGLPTLFVILNDQGMGTIRHGQLLGGAEELGWEIPAIDFAAMARACGANGFTISSSSDFDSIDLDELLTGTKPTLLDVKIDKDEVPPMGERMKVLLHKQH